MKILDFDLKAHGFINPGLITIRDYLEYAKRGGPCSNCPAEIKPKTRVRVVITNRVPGHKCGYRYCQACVWSMAKNDHGAELDRRYRLMPILALEVKCAG